MKKTALLIAVCLLAVAARAIELSLEENRGERGSVGYVDIQRLFADSPDALKAKEGFEDLVRQAEERVNLRKAELLKLHHELDRTRAERDALSMVMDTAPAASTAAAPSPAAPAPTALSTAAPAAVALSTAAAASNAVALSTSAAARVAVSTAAASPSIKELALPGMAPTTAAPTAPPVAAVAVSSPAAPAVAISSSAAPAPSTKTAAPAAPVITSTGIAAAAAMFPAAPAPVPVVSAPTGPTPVQRLLEFDAKIIKIQAEIADKESSLTHEHDEADRGLLDAESRKTDQVLARLYRAVSEVARREGVSVVIDKASILYGQPAVDLTDKVLKYLKENPQQ